ncbi:hypothetical protein [Tenuibacillus multivorans]|uniref:Uncharacterized protein n=1 Tax=Tenuibacillus multivorans TaxID=237069 RepID=A0A1G9X714_9BACI|nr:hypothetical protein [Tenuibacillus multivorans]GEL78663.1 hypothetical protein TMU01_28980 [Tenuibacillus multivorans]SDM92550.1 hypothetical protein SAMN05216498_1043 [Tenuibacillus multivorans]
MKQLIKYQKYIFYSCIMFVFMYRLFLANIPEFFPLAFELGDIFYRFSFSFSAAYIFFLLVTKIPKSQEKTHIYTYANHKKDIIVNSFFHLVEKLIEYSNDVAKDPQKPIDIRKHAIAKVLLEQKSLDKWNLNEYDCKIIFSLIEPLNDSPFYRISNHDDFPFKPIPWAKHLNRFSYNIRNEILELFSVMPHLEAKHVEVLTTILESDFFRTSKNIDTLEYGEDLEYLHSSFYILYQTVQELNEKWE